MFSICSIAFAANQIDFIPAAFGVLLIAGGITNVWGIRAYGLDWREWKHNYRTSPGFTMFTRVALSILGVTLIGLTIYNAVTGV